MDVNKLDPILNKESILKTANARELGQDPQDVLQRYQTYALTHVPLGETGKQLANLQRVITQNKTCAIGTIVGPYGYGKTSTAVHLWHELREKQILAVPPFLWVNLQELVDAVYHWMRFEFQQGPAKYLDELDVLYEKYAVLGLSRIEEELDADVAQEWFEKGLLNLELRPDDVVQFYSEATNLALKAGYAGLAIFTDELQATVAEYKPSRDQFFNDLFQVVKDTLGRPGKWALIISTDEDTEAMIAKLRQDILQRMQSSALYFRVKEVYNRRQYPAELWSAFEERFGFDGRDVILPETLESIGQIAAREDLGAGPRMVTDALALAVSHYKTSQTAYTPLHFVDDFLEGLVKFDQRGKFGTAVKKALDNVEVQADEPYQNVVKLLAAFPAGCSNKLLERFNMLESFGNFPPLARRELVVERSEGYTLRYLLEEERPPEYVEQRLSNEFARRFIPGAKYAQMAAKGFLEHILLEETFSGDWKGGRSTVKTRGDIKYTQQTLTGTFDRRYPQRKVSIAASAVSQSPSPEWTKLDPEADIELRFELNYGLAATEPNQLLISPERPDVAVFQLNMNGIQEEAARKILPNILFDFYGADKMTPLLTLALLQYLFEHSGELPDDVNRVKMIAGGLRQFALTFLLGEDLAVNEDEFSSAMVGHERVRDLFKTQCRLLYPGYKTLMAGKKWQADLQQYNYALERAIADEGVTVARGRRTWETTKNEVADAFRIPKLSLTRLETLLDTLGDLIVKEEYSGRGGDSPVKLRFQLHPLESQWLEQLEESEETGSYNGTEVPALFAVDLIRKTGQQGYTMEEIQEVMQLLQSREFLAFDQRQGLLLRKIEDIVELKDVVEGLIEKLDENVSRLDAAVPEFERERFNISELHQKFAEAGARDDLEMLKNEVRRRSAGLLSFATSTAARRRHQYAETRREMVNYVQVGVPAWLSQPYSDSPLQDLLEQQRKHLAGAFESTLREMRKLIGECATFLAELPEQPVESIILLQKATPELRKEFSRLETRLRSYDDQKEDLEAWRTVIERMITFETQVQEVDEKYGSDRWCRAVASLWQEQRDQIEANPLNIPSLHRDLEQKSASLLQDLARWLENRREDFEQQRERYESALNEAGRDTRLRIPFDQQNPAESYSALIETVQQYLADYLQDLQRRLTQVIQRIRYAEQVQEADLAQAEEQATAALERANSLQALLSMKLLQDIKKAEGVLLAPLQKTHEQEQALASDVQQALQKRPPTDQEGELLARLKGLGSNGEIDLYSLIMRQIDQEDEAVDLDQLVHDLQALFQKNQIGIRIRLL